jgi:5-methylcytosine-specific restriction endonuclease McrA
MKEIYSRLPGAAGFDEGTYCLGKPCESKHEWKSSGLTLRVRSNGKCVQCKKDWYKANKEEQRRKAKERMAAKRQNPEYREIHRERSRLSKAKARATKGRVSKSGLLVPPHLCGAGLRPRDLRMFIERGFSLEKLTLEAIAQQQTLWQHIKAMRAGPSVARLAMNEQQRYWKENPEAQKEHDRQWGQAQWWLKYQITPELRLYHREKSKRRKAQDRGQTPAQVPVSALRQRFNEFGNCCAYCGDGGDMQIEHIQPISKGGAHDIGNIVPACFRCNTSKRNHEMEEWYRSQPFFSELRLHRIRRVMRQPEAYQLAML